MRVCATRSVGLSIQCVRITCNSSNNVASHRIDGQVQRNGTVASRSVCDLLEVGARSCVSLTIQRIAAARSLRQCRACTLINDQV